MLHGFRISKRHIKLQTRVTLESNLTGCVSTNQKRGPELLQEMCKEETDKSNTFKEIIPIHSTNATWEVGKWANKI